MTKNGFFITGTDTDVGKSYIGAQLARYFYTQGKPVQPRKPIESGCTLLNNKLMPSDGLAYYEAIDKQLPLDIITPYRFEPAIAPPQAMTASNQVNLQQVINAVYRDTQDGDLMVIEGAGGFYSPLCSDASNADLAVALQLPIILVVANKVGCINHCLLSIEAILNQGLHINAIVLNDIFHHQDLLRQNYDSLHSALQKQNVELSYKLLLMNRGDHITDEIEKIIF